MTFRSSGFAERNLDFRSTHLHLSPLSRITSKNHFSWADSTVFHLQPHQQAFNHHKWGIWEMNGTKNMISWENEGGKHCQMLQNSTLNDDDARVIHLLIFLKKKFRDFLKIKILFAVAWTFSIIAKNMKCLQCLTLWLHYSAWVNEWQ